MEVGSVSTGFCFLCGHSSAEYVLTAFFIRSCRSRGLCGDMGRCALRVGSDAIGNCARLSFSSEHGLDTLTSSRFFFRILTNKTLCCRDT